MLTLALHAIGRAQYSQRATTCRGRSYSPFSLSLPHWGFASAIASAILTNLSSNFDPHGRCQRNAQVCSKRTGGRGSDKERTVRRPVEGKEEGGWKGRMKRMGKKRTSSPGGEEKGIDKGRKKKSKHTTPIYYDGQVLPRPEEKQEGDAQALLYYDFRISWAHGHYAEVIQAEVGARAV